MKLSLFLILLLAMPCFAQEPVTLDLDTVDGLIIDAPGGYTQAEHSFGSVPIRDGQPAQGLTVALNAGDGIVFYGPAIETGPGEVLVECAVWCTGPEVALALVAMNLPDYSMMANLPASGEKYLSGWHTIRVIFDPDDDTLMPGFQIVSTGATATTVYVDDITVTPIRSLGPEKVLELFEMAVLPTPSPTATVNPTPTPTSTPPTHYEPEIVLDLPDLPSGAKPLEMVLIQPETFTMGSSEDERGRYADEGPQHEVSITQAFYLGKYEVTQAQWEAVMGSNPATNPDYTSYSAGDDYPVYYVSWNDCQAFIEQLNGLNLGTFRLPTEAEWECACRASTDTRFSFGDALECSDSLSYCDTMDEFVWWSGNRTYGGEQAGPKEVGRKIPNLWGLYDLHGNLNEWCGDWFGSYTSAPKTDPRGPSTGSNRVFRGGGWGSYGLGCRSAYRGDYSLDGRAADIGLRLLRSSP